MAIEEEWSVCDIEFDVKHAPPLKTYLHLSHFFFGKSQEFLRRTVVDFFKNLFRYALFKCFVLISFIWKLVN